MTKVLQFGEGNFLRTFVDHYFDTLNEEGGEFSVHIVKPISFGSLENFRIVLPFGASQDSLPCFLQSNP